MSGKIRERDVDCSFCGSVCIMKSRYMREDSVIPLYSCYDCDCGYIKIIEGKVAERDLCFERVPGEKGVLWENGRKKETKIKLMDGRTMEIIETRRIRE